MPLPTPNDKETEKDFVGRCMGDSKVNEEFPEEKQRSAVCYRQFTSKKAEPNDERETDIVSSMSVATISVMSPKDGGPAEHKLQPCGKKLWQGTLIKSVPEAFQPSKLTSDDGVWAYASVEIQDRDQDIIRTDGIDYSEYHNPQNNTYMKVLPQHIRMLADGSPPVIGRVEQFQKTTTPDGYNALAFYMSWAKDGKGELTDLAKKYKSLYDGGYLDSFSIGAEGLERKPIKGGGYDYTKTALMEISGVTLPANKRASVIRSLETFGSDLMAPEVIINMLSDISEGLEKQNKNITLELEKAIEPLLERLDYLETLVSKSEAPKTTDLKEGDQKNQKVMQEKALLNVQAEIAKLLKKTL